MTTDPSSPPNGRTQGTSHQYIVDRLRRAGHVEWLRAIEARRITAFAVACELGWATRPPTLLGERANQSKRRRQRLAEERQRLQPAPDKLTPYQREFLLYGPTIASAPPSLTRPRSRQPGSDTGRPCSQTTQSAGGPGRGAMSGTSSPEFFFWPVRRIWD
jgi:hypothetical protein